MIETIRSEQNPRFQLWRRIATSARERRQSGLIWLEGLRLVEEGMLALSRRSQVSAETALLVDPTQSPSWRLLQQRLEQGDLRPPPVFSLEARLWGRLSQVEQPQGLALVMPWPMPQSSLEEAVLSAQPWQDWVVLDGLQDPGNVGSLVRAAAGAGLGGAVLLQGTAEAYSPKALRAGMGAQFRLSLWEGVERAHWLELSAKRGMLNVLTLAPHAAETTSLWEARALTQPSPLAWIMGQEGDGLHPGWLAPAPQLRLTIPQASGLESLNVTTAAAVCFFERARLRWTQGG